MKTRQFASDNNAGVCPEVWDALLSANTNHAPGYGEDLITAQAANLIRDVFEKDCEVFFVFNGTAANSLALASVGRSFHSVLCHEYAHVETDECGAPEFFSHGMKVLQLPGKYGKIDPTEIRDRVERRKDIHYPKPKAITLTQSTELGTVYTCEEIQHLTSEARRFGLCVHMDGARFSNAVASLGKTPAEITWKSGVDILCLGGTKMGMPMGEAILFFNKEQAYEFDYRCKQAGQLASKMRFLAAPWLGLLQNNRWIERAQHANRMALKLRDEFSRYPEIEIMNPVEANAVFARLPEKASKHLQAQGWKFYSFIGSGGYRFMCSWDTNESDINELARDLAVGMSA